MGCALDPTHHSSGVNMASWPADVGSGESAKISVCVCPLPDKYASSSVNKRQRLALDFLGSIDQTGEFLALLEDEEVDEVKQERMEVSGRKRADHA